MTILTSYTSVTITSLPRRRRHCRGGLRSLHRPRLRSRTSEAPAGRHSVRRIVASPGCHIVSRRHPEGLRTAAEALALSRAMDAECVHGTGQPCLVPRSTGCRAICVVSIVPDTAGGRSPLSAERSRVEGSATR